MGVGSLNLPFDGDTEALRTNVGGCTVPLSQKEKPRTVAETGGAKGGRMSNVAHMASTRQYVGRFISEGFVTLTPSQAVTILHDCTFAGQRAISQTHVESLAYMMGHGQWRAKDQIDFARLGDRLILVNGYHRMNAQVAGDATVEWSIVIHDCVDPAQVRELYYSFDTNVRARTGNQVLNAVGFADEHGLKSAMGKALFNAVPIIGNGFSASLKDRDYLTANVMELRLLKAAEYADAARRYEMALDGADGMGFRRKFYNARLAAVALVTLRYQPDKAFAFWQGVAQNDGLRRGDPRKALVNDLRSRALNAGAQTDGMIVPAIAWNAFFAGRDLRLIKVLRDARVRIAGTPFAG